MKTLILFKYIMIGKIINPFSKKLKDRITIICLKLCLISLSHKNKMVWILIYKIAKIQLFIKMIIFIKENLHKAKIYPKKIVSYDKIEEVLMENNLKLNFYKNKISLMNLISALSFSFYFKLIKSSIITHI